MLKATEAVVYSIGQWLWIKSQLSQPSQGVRYDDVAHNLYWVISKSQEVWGGRSLDEKWEILLTPQEKHLAKRVMGGNGRDIDPG